MQSMSKKLLALNAGPATFFFNSSGYFFYDGTSCNWLTFCDFECEVYNYDSRFLDFVGVWTITSKRGIDSINQKVNVWVGNAIDAAGVFPIYLYMDYTTLYYAGLDKLDPKTQTGGCASYYYPTIVVEDPDYSAFASGTIESLGCQDTTENWEIEEVVSVSNAFGLSMASLITLASMMLVTQL